MRIKMIIILTLTSLLGAHAQKRHNSGLPEEVLAWTKSTMDAFSYKRYASLKDAMIDNDFYIPLIFQGAKNQPLTYEFSVDSVFQRNIPKTYFYESKKIKTLFKHYLFVKKLEDDAYRNVLLKNPENFKYSIRKLPRDKKDIVTPRNITKRTQDAKIDVAQKNTLPEEVDPVIKFIPDRRYWTSNAELSLKFTQSHISPNWHKGGTDYLSIYGRFVFYYNYAKGKTKLNNTLDASALFYNAPDDTLRNYRVNSDVLRFASQFGYQAFGKWDYSTSFTFTSQMFNNFAANTNNKMASFLAPYKLNLTVGMKYTLNTKSKKPNRTFSLPIEISPIDFMSMQSHVKTTDLLARHGFPANEDGTRKSSYHTIGSSININRINAKFNKNLSMTWRLYFFTNYERVLAESETHFDFIISRYFSASFDINMRFDDSVVKKEDYDTYLQYTELFSFGFNYKW